MLQNVKPHQYCQAIVLSLDEFRDLVYELCGTDHIDVDYDGYDLTLCGKYGDSGDIKQALSKHFGIEIDSIHTDRTEHIGVWIAFKDREVRKENKK